MILITTLACGNCVYYAMWHKFPPINSWVFIIPCWFLMLSVIRTSTGKPIPAIPPVYVAIPLVLVVFFIAPGMIDPPLGFWIPIGCIIGTLVGVFRSQSAEFKRTHIVTATVAIVTLVGFGFLDDIMYNQMPAIEKEKYIPVWEVDRNKKVQKRVK